MRTRGEPPYLYPLSRERRNPFMAGRRISEPSSPWDIIPRPSAPPHVFRGRKGFTRRRKKCFLLVGGKSFLTWDLDDPISLLLPSAVEVMPIVHDLLLSLVYNVEKGYVRMDYLFRNSRLHGERERERECTIYPKRLRSYSRERFFSCLL